MNTPAHLLLTAALYARPTAGAPRPARQARINAAALAGSLIPDASLYVMVLWEARVNARTPAQIFGEDYRDPFWTTVFSVDNSIPLWAALLALGLALRLAPLAALAGAALLHCAVDLPLHHNDGRPHFQPFTGWIYESPVSYWDPAHYGDIVGPVEFALCLALAALLRRRFRSRIVHALLAAALLAEVAPALVFPLVL